MFNFIGNTKEKNINRELASKREKKPLWPPIQITGGARLPKINTNLYLGPIVLWLTRTKVIVRKPTCLWTLTSAPYHNTTANFKKKFLYLPKL